MNLQRNTENNRICQTWSCHSMTSEVITSAFQWRIWKALFCHHFLSRFVPLNKHSPHFQTLTTWSAIFTVDQSNWSFWTLDILTSFAIVLWAHHQLGALILPGICVHLMSQLNTALYQVGDSNLITMECNEFAHHMSVLLTGDKAKGHHLLLNCWTHLSTFASTIVVLDIWTIWTVTWLRVNTL